MKKIIFEKIKTVFIVCMILIIGFGRFSLADETKWLSIGMLQNWFSSTGNEVEVGRRHLIPDQQDGLLWPALFVDQDMQAAKALWIGATNYSDPISRQTYNYKVVHNGPRDLDERSEFMPAEFKLYGKFNHPAVIVDGDLASQTVYLDADVMVDEDLLTERMIYNVVNTSMGVTMTRKIYANSQQYNDNYFIYDYVFENTGIYNLNGDKHNMTLEGVMFFFQYRWAMTKWACSYGNNYMPQSSTWGHNTMNDVFHPNYGDDIRAIYAWHGLHSKSGHDNIGAPNDGTGDLQANGFLGATQFPGVIVLHADNSASDKSDDSDQPTNTPYLGSDELITQSGADQFNAARMTKEYSKMIERHPTLTHAEAVGSGYPDLFTGDIGSNPGGFSQGIGFGPYSLAPGESIHIVLAECVNGLSWEMRKEIGAKWWEKAGLGGSPEMILPDGSSTSDADEYKNAWVFTGKDSLLKTFDRAMTCFNNNLQIDEAPPPPDKFEVISGGDRITLDWSTSAESYPHFAGYNIYRSIHTPDTTFELIYSCGQGTDNPLINTYEDKSAQRGFDYYYYVTTFDDGTVNTIEPGVSLESSLFWTRTTEPAYLRRQPGKNLSDIRIVPNPYNIRAKNLQFGQSAPDRIMFYNLPPACTIKIFTERGDYIKTIDHFDGSGDEAWNSITSSRQVIVSGVYIAYFETPEGNTIIKKFIIIR